LISKLADNEPCWKHNDPIVWTPKMIKRLKESENKVARVVDYWVDSILKGFITDFQLTQQYPTVKISTYFSKVHEVGI